MRSHPHQHREFSAAEHRLLRMAEMLHADASNLRDVAPVLRSEQERKEDVSQKTGEQRLQKLVDETNGVISPFLEKLRALDDATSDRLQTEFDAYMRNAAKSAERNGIAGLSEQEFTALKEEVTKQVHSVLESIMGGIDAGGDKAKKEAAQKKTEEERKKRTLSQVKENMEKAGKEHEAKERADLEKRIDRNALGNLENPAAVQGEFEKFQNKQNALQKAQTELQEYMQHTQEFHEKAQEHLKELQEPPVAASLAGAGAGAAIGATIGSIFPVVGTSIGAGVGAVIGYMATRYGNHLVNEQKIQSATVEYNTKIESAKRFSDKRRTMMTSYAVEQEEDSKVLGQVPGNLQQRQEEGYKKRSGELIEGQGNIKTEQEKRSKQITDIHTSRQTLQKHETELKQRREDLQKRQMDLQTGDQSLAKQRAELAENRTKIEEAVRQARDSIGKLRAANPNDPRIQQLTQQLEKMEQGRQQGEKGAVALTDAEQNIKKTTQDVQASLTDTARNEMEIKNQNVSLEETLKLIAGTLPELETYEKNLTAGLEDLEKNYAGTIQEAGETSSRISAEIFKTSVTNIKAAGDMDRMLEPVMKLPPVEAPSLASNLWHGTMDGIGHALKFVITDTIGGALDIASKWLKETVKDIPVLKHAVHVALFPLDVTSGIVHGVGELCEGITTMLGHPLMTLEGMGAMIGRDPKTGEWSFATAGNALTEMGKALISWNEMSNGEVGKGVGKIALNVIMTATGMEAVGAGGVAARGAFIAAREAGNGIAMATAKAGIAGIKAAGMAFGGNALSDMKTIYQMARSEGKTFTQAALSAARAGAGTLIHDTAENVTHLGKGIAQLPGNIISGAGHLLSAPKMIYQHFKTPKLARLAASVEAHETGLSALMKQINECKIGGKLAGDIPQLAGKTAEQIAAMTAGELMAAGITNVGALRQLRQYRKILPQFEGMEASLAATQNRMAQQMALEQKQTTIAVTKKLQDNIASNPRLVAAERQLRRQLTDPTVPFEDISYLENQYTKLAKDAGLSEADAHRLLTQYKMELLEGSGGSKTLPAAASTSLPAQEIQPAPIAPPAPAEPAPRPVAPRSEPSPPATPPPTPPASGQPEIKSAAAARNAPPEPPPAPPTIPLSQPDVRPVPATRPSATIEPPPTPRPVPQVQIPLDSNIGNPANRPPVAPPAAPVQPVLRIEPLPSASPAVPHSSPAVAPLPAGPRIPSEIPVAKPALTLESTLSDFRANTGSEISIARKNGEIKKWKIYGIDENEGKVILQHPNGRDFIRETPDRILGRMERAQQLEELKLKPDVIKKPAPPPVVEPKPAPKPQPAPVETPPAPPKDVPPARPEVPKAKPAVPENIPVALPAEPLPPPKYANPTGNGKFTIPTENGKNMTVTADELMARMGMERGSDVRIWRRSEERWETWQVKDIDSKTGKITLVDGNGYAIRESADRIVQRINGPQTLPQAPKNPTLPTRTPLNKGEEAMILRSDGSLMKGHVSFNPEDGWHIVDKNGLKKPFDPKNPKDVWHARDFEKLRPQDLADLPEYARVKVHLRAREFLAKHQSLPDASFNKLFPPDAVIQQGQLGDCWLVAALASVKENSHFPQLMKTAMAEVSEGGKLVAWDVRLPLGSTTGKTMRITLKDIEKHGRSVLPMNAPNGFRILEAAVAKMEKRLHKVQLRSGKIPLYTKEGELNIQQVLKSGTGNEALDYLFGRNSTQNVIRGDGFKPLVETGSEGCKKVMALFENFTNEKDIVTVQTTTLPKNSKKITYREHGHDFYHSHTYSIQSVNKADRTVIIANPHNTAKPIVLTWEQATDVFASFRGVELDATRIFSGPPLKPARVKPAVAPKSRGRTSSTVDLDHELAETSSARVTATPERPAGIGQTPHATPEIPLPGTRPAHIPQAAHIDPAVERLATTSTHPETRAQVQKILDDVNARHPGGFPEKNFTTIREFDHCYVAIDEAGRLRTFDSAMQFQSARSRHTLTKHIEELLAKDPAIATLPPNERAAAISKMIEEKYKIHIDFISNERTQAQLDSIFRDMEGVPEESLRKLREHTEKHALYQNLDNLEQFVSHGFDHSLNVMYHMENVIADNPQILQSMMTRYNITEAESRAMMKLIAVYHDFGYPELARIGKGDLSKALHAVTGAEIAGSGEFFHIMEDVFQVNSRPPAFRRSFDQLIHEFRDGILYHSADKVEIFRDAKVIIGHGEFIIDANNVVEVYTHFRGRYGTDRMRVVCKESTAVEMKQALVKHGYSLDHIEFAQPLADEVTLMGEFRGRAMDLLNKKDKKLGIQFKQVALEEHPMNFMIRLTDNCDMTSQRMSALQRSNPFKEIYRAFGPLEGDLEFTALGKMQGCSTGKLLDRLESLQKGKITADKVLVAPELRQVLGELFANDPRASQIFERIKKAGTAASTSVEAEQIIVLYKEMIIDRILSHPAHIADVEKLAAELRVSVAEARTRVHRIGMQQSTVDIRHFGGCEMIQDVKIRLGCRCGCHGGHLKVTVDGPEYARLNQTQVTEEMNLANGTPVPVQVGIGEYQIWRSFDAYRSLTFDGNQIQVTVIDGHTTQQIIADFGAHFSRRNPAMGV